MKFAARLAWILVMLAFVSLLGSSFAQAQAPSERYFKETGHFVKGEFWVKYNATPNAQELFGSPISIAFVSPTNGRLVQYFQKVRFELDSSRPVSQRVQISGLYADIPLPVLPSGAAEPASGCRFFSETGFQVCLAFLQFYEANGGLETFGYPLSNLVQRENGFQVQYFQKARLELRPSLPAGKRVVTGELGREAFYQLRENPAYLAAEPFGDTTTQVTALKVRAYPQYPVASLSGYQTIFVIVQDQRLFQIPGAQIEIFLILPTGERLQITPIQQTDENGTLKITFPYRSQSTGMARLEIIARLGDQLIGKTSTSFRIWW
jgi:hypothetical protein